MYEQVFYITILVGILFLLLRSRREALPEEMTEDTEGPFRGLKLLFDRAAVHLVRQRPGRHRSGTRDETTRERAAACRLRSMLVFAAAAALLALLVNCAENSETLLVEGRYIRRENYGGNGRDVTVTAFPEKNGTADEENSYGEFSLHVSPREYTAEETAVLAEEAMEALPAVLAGENPDLEHVSGKLSFVSELEGYPFRITWTPEDFGLINAGGEVAANLIPENGKTTGVRAKLIYRDRQYERHYPVKLCRPEETGAARRIRLIREALEQAGEAQAEEAVLTLPSEIEGEPVVWREKNTNTGRLLFLLVAAAGVVSWILADREQEKHREERKRRLQLAYPQLVNRFVLYLGAGMSVRNIFRKLEKETGQAELKEELSRACHELDTGISEAQVYGHFGEHCGLRSYRRLAAILVQNLRKGNRELLRVLQEEAGSAEEERRYLARQLGEEAGTKLLVPMVLLLSVTMVIIIIPAFLGFT